MIVALTSVLPDSQPAVDLQLTKYEVVAVKLGVMNDAPVAIDAPPVADEYHVAVPVEQVAPNVTIPLPQIAAGVTVGAFGAVSTVFFTILDSPLI